METNTENILSYSKLPQKLPIKKLGWQYQKLAGYVKMHSLARINEILVNTNTNDDVGFLVDLTFTRIRNNNILVTGSINQKVKVLCQRCMQEMDYIIDTNMHVIITENIKRPNNISSDLDDCEVIELQSQDMLDLYQLIEDEMILSLPIVVKHDDANIQCSEYSKILI